MRTITFLLSLTVRGHRLSRTQPDVATYLICGVMGPWGRSLSDVLAIRMICTFSKHSTATASIVVTKSNDTG